MRRNSLCIIAYDDLFGEFDDDDEEEDDIDDGAFEAKYLSSGIDLNDSTFKSTCSIGRTQRQKLIDEVRLSTTSSEQEVVSLDEKSRPQAAPKSGSTTPEVEQNQQYYPKETDTAIDNVSNMTSDLAKFAIGHLDKYQWRLPLLEMDKKFRDKTYYKHYTDTYISSLRSKLGQFLTDNQLISNPMKYHLQREFDNHMRYSRMFDLLREYYHSLGGAFFSFATPSPDEEIVIGCRLGKKGCYHIQHDII